MSQKKSLIKAADARISITRRQVVNQATFQANICRVISSNLHTNEAIRRMTKGVPKVRNCPFLPLKMLSKTRSRRRCQWT